MKQLEWARHLTACREQELAGVELSARNAAFMSKIDTLLEAFPFDFPTALIALGLGDSQLLSEVPVYESIAAASFEVWPLVRKILDDGNSLVRISAGGEEITILELFTGEQQAKPLYIDRWKYEIVDRGVTVIVGPYGGLVIPFESLQSMILDLPKGPEEPRIVRLRRI